MEVKSFWLWNTSTFSYSNVLCGDPSLQSHHCLMWSRMEPDEQMNRCTRWTDAEGSWTSLWYISLILSLILRKFIKWPIHLRLDMGSISTSSSSSCVRNQQTSSSVYVVIISILFILLTVTFVLLSTRKQARIPILIVLSFFSWLKLIFQPSRKEINDLPYIELKTVEITVSNRAVKNQFVTTDASNIFPKYF